MTKKASKKLDSKVKPMAKITKDKYKKPKKDGNGDMTIKEIRESGKTIEWDDNGTIRNVPVDLRNRDCVPIVEAEFEKSINEILEDESIEL